MTIKAQIDYCKILADRPDLLLQVLLDQVRRYRLAVAPADRAREEAELFAVADMIGERL